MDKLVLSSKILETGVTQCGVWCLLKTCGREGRVVNPHSRGLPPTCRLGPALTSPLGLRRRVTKLRPGWKWRGFLPTDEGGRFLVLPGPLPHTWGRRQARVSRAARGGARGLGRSGPYREVALRRQQRVGREAVQVHREVALELLQCEATQVHCLFH